MRLDKIRHDLCELYLIFQSGDAALLVGQESRQRVDIGVVDAGDVGIRDHNEWQVTEGLNAMGEPYRQEG